MFDPKYVSDAKLVVFNDTNGISRFNWTGNQLVDMLLVVTEVEIKGKTDKQSNNYDKMMFKASVDNCDISKNVVGNFVTKWISTHLDQYSNYKFECPLKKGFLYAVNFPVFEDKFIPYAVTGFAGRFVLAATIKAKVEGVESFVHITTTKIYGKAVPNPPIKI